MRLFVWGRSIVLGWVALVGIAYGVERPLLHWAEPFFGASWIATAHLAFDCMTLAAAGWVTGRLNRPHASLSAGLLAATLCFWDFGKALALNVPWLLQLILNSFHDSRFLDSMVTSAETHVLLFTCLMAGAALSHRREKAISIIDAESR
jgi:hypothetical protein